MASQWLVWIVETDMINMMTERYVYATEASDVQRTAPGQSCRIIFRPYQTRSRRHVSISDELGGTLGGTHAPCRYYIISNSE